MSAREPIEILLVEDSRGDARLVKEAMKDAKVRNHVSHVRDGQAAIDRLRAPGAPRPDLILLDMVMPVKDGRAVLEVLKNDATLRRIPILILSALREEKDILAAYNLHANAYIHKPVSLDEMGKMVEAVDNFWLSIARLPPRDRADG